jgi:hypothetical protein
VLAIATKATITQINPSVAVQATATGTLNTNMVKYTRTSAQTSNIATNNVIICDTSETILGTGISVNTTTGQITLTAGKTYRLRGSIPTFTASSGALQYCWYNETTSAWIGESAAQYPPSNNAAYGAMGGTAEVVLTVGSTTVVSFRVLRNSGVVSLGGNTDFSTIGSYPWIDAQEITNSFSLTTLSTLSTSSAVDVGGKLTTNSLVNHNYVGSVDAVLSLTGAATRGGAGYHDFLRVTNQTSTAVISTNTKNFRLASDGTLQIINSQYTNNIFNLDDSGNLTIPGNLTVSGTVNGHTFSGPDNASATWMWLGTWTTVQNGECLYMRLISHAGYNAVANQNQVTELMFATSNNSSYIAGSTGNYYAAGSASVNSRLGTGGNPTTYQAPVKFRIVQVSVTSYQIYVYYGAAYMGRANYSVQIGPATTWTDSSSTVSAPGGNYLEITPTSF